MIYILFSGTFLSLQDKEENDEFIQNWSEHKANLVPWEKNYIRRMNIKFRINFYDSILTIIIERHV